MECDWEQLGVGTSFFIGIAGVARCAFGVAERHVEWLGIHMREETLTSHYSMLEAYFKYYLLDI